MYSVYIPLLPLLLNLSTRTTYAQIAIAIRASGSNEITAQANGQSRTITKINANHKELFHITDQLLKNAVFKLSGQQTEVYIDDDGDLYENYNLEPVGTLLKPNGTTVKVIKEKIVLNKLQVFNPEAIAKSQVVELKGSIEDSVTCVYKQKDVFHAVVAHIIDVVGLGKSSWNMTSTFGKDMSDTRVVPISNASFILDLEPAQYAKAYLTATKVTAVIKVNYIAMLTGHVLAKFVNSYIWGYENYDIETVMAAVGMPHTVMLREEITLQFYTDCVTNVYGILQATNDLRCSFTTIDGTEEIPHLNWKKDQREFAPLSVPQFNDDMFNNASRNPVAIVLLVICLFTKVHII